jgi:hypothetical protein
LGLNLQTAKINCQQPANIRAGPDYLQTTCKQELLSQGSFVNSPVRPT